MYDATKGWQMAGASLFVMTYFDPSLLGVLLRFAGAVDGLAFGRGRHVVTSGMRWPFSILHLDDRGWRDSSGRGGQRHGNGSMKGERRKVVSDDGAGGDTRAVEGRQDDCAPGSGKAILGWAGRDARWCAMATCPVLRRACQAGATARMGDGAGAGVDREPAGD